MRSEQELHLDDFSIRGVQDRHVTPDEIQNTIFVLEIGDIRMCHLGDNRAEVPQSALRAIGPVDLLMVPVDDSSHLLRFWEVNQLIATFRPRIMVPVHYLIPGLTDPGSTLLPPTSWLGTQASVKLLGRDSIEIGPDDLPRSREVLVFDAYPR